MPVAVAGMHRSGTSMVVRLLNLCGLYLGKEEDLLSATENNPEGYWESTKFLKTNDEILAAFGGKWDAPPLLETGWETSPDLAEIRRTANLAIEEISQQPIWGWKDPRNSLTLPFWKGLIPNLKIIVCLRNPFEVYYSLTRRESASSNFSYNLWLIYYQELIASTKPEERIFTHYDSFFRDPRSELRRLLNFLELEASDEVIDTACQTILPGLKHNRGSINDLYATNPSSKLLDLYRELCLRAGPVYGFGLSEEENIFLQNITPEKKFVREEILRHQQEIVQPMDEKAKFQEDITKLKRDLNDILTSRSWQFVGILQKIRLFFVPRGSAREKILKVVFNILSLVCLIKIIFILVREAISSLLLGIRNRGQKMKEPTHAMPAVVEKDYGESSRELRTSNVQLNAPRVSVAIPLYRSARFIDTIIANIDAMPKHDIEILVSDRHCYDDTIDRLMDRYAADPRMRFFKHQDGLDWVGNINDLLQEARGEYWRFLPHDDLSPPGSLESLISALDIHKDAVLAYGPSQAIDLEGNRIPGLDHWYPQPKHAENNSTLGTALEMCWNWDLFAGSFKALIRRKVLVENNLFVRSTFRQVIPDRCWQFALCLLGRFHFVPEALYLKRFYPGSTSHQWEFTSRTYYSAAWVMSTYLWDLLGPRSARWYGIWDVWVNAQRLADWQNTPNHGRRPDYQVAPDFLSWIVNRFFLLNTLWLQGFNESRKRKIDTLRLMSLPQKRYS